jgi:hypothetical protein
VTTAKKLGDVAAKLERAAELHYIQEPRSKSDEREANAVASLITALQSTDEAVIYLSSILFVKINGSVTAHVLSEKQILQLSEDPSLLRDPRTLHKQLAIAGKIDDDSATTLSTLHSQHETTEIPGLPEQGKHASMD